MQDKLQLNLPTYDYKLQFKRDKPYIFDIIRKKYIRLEPEEWVRQHFVNYMIQNGYPTGLIKIESGHQFNNLLRRTDIVAYNREAKAYLLVECKSPDVNIDKKVLQQVANYNRTLKAPFLAVTNGLKHFFFRIDFKNSSYQTLTELPPFST